MRGHLPISLRCTAAPQTRCSSPRALLQTRTRQRVVVTLRRRMRTATASLFALTAATSSLAAVVPRWQHALKCSDLWDAAPKMIANLEVYVAEDVPGESASRSANLEESRDSLPPEGATCEMHAALPRLTPNTPFAQPAPTLPLRMRRRPTLHRFPTCQQSAALARTSTPATCQSLALP